MNGLQLSLSSRPELELQLLTLNPETFPSSLTRSVAFRGERRVTDPLRRLYFIYVALISNASFVSQKSTVPDEKKGDGEFYLRFTCVFVLMNTLL